MKFNTRKLEEFEEEFKQLLTKYNAQINPDSKIAKQWVSVLAGMFTKVVIFEDEPKEK